MSFIRGSVVHHKVMGMGVVVNILEETNSESVEVRMENGQKEKFFPEELITDEDVRAKREEEVRSVVRSNAERARKRVGL